MSEQEKSAFEKELLELMAKHGIFWTAHNGMETFIFQSQIFLRTIIGNHSAHKESGPLTMEALTAGTENWQRILVSP